MNVFQKERERLIEEERTTEILRNKEKERRKDILDKMRKRNKELGLDQSDITYNQQDYDELDSNDELAVIGKRYRQQYTPTNNISDSVSRLNPPIVYRVIDKPTSRDDEEVDRDRTIIEDKETSYSPLDMLNKKILDKQKQHGY